MSGIRWGKVQPTAGLDTIIIVASGNSVRYIDTNVVRHMQQSGAHIIAVNGAAEVYNFSDSWFTLDPWGLHGPQLPKPFSGKLYAAVPDDFGTPSARSTQHRVTPMPGITFLHRLQSHNYTMTSSDSAYVLGLSEDQSCISTGNSGYGALNLAYHMRPKKIYLLGIDGGIGYFYTTKSKNRPLKSLEILFNSASSQLLERGIEVINVSPESVVKCFPKMHQKDFNKLL